jgi:cobalt/nickel transport system permease protein
MHIPDGYLSPQTCAALYAGMVPAWWVASRKVQAKVRTQHVPLLALGAAFSFIVMMFNIPIPDGTSAHATGAALIAVLLGPWAACIAVSVALLIQALFFGDGGVLAFAANAFNIALVMPWVAYGCYRLLARKAPLTSRRRVVAAAVGAYAGINAAALLTAIEFGIQPELFTRDDGTPLYSPFGLGEAIPAMMIPHLLVAGVVEGALTAGVVAYLQRANLPLLRLNAPEVPLRDGRSRVNPVRAGLVAIGVLAVLTPIGLLAPGGAYGEDAPDELDLGRYGLDAVPSGLREYSDFWGSTLLPDYGDGSGWQYVLSAVIGIAVAGGVVYGLALVSRRLSDRARRVRREGDETP